MVAAAKDAEIVHRDKYPAGTYTVVRPLADGRVEILIVTPKAKRT
jgi:hypothetical protein